MNQRIVSQPDVGTYSMRKVPETPKNGDVNGGSSSSLRQSFEEHVHARLRGKLMRAHAALYADKTGSLSVVSRSRLERAVSAFLAELSVQGPAGQGSLGGLSSPSTVASRVERSSRNRSETAKKQVQDNLKRREQARFKKFHS